MNMNMYNLLEEVQAFVKSDDEVAKTLANNIKEITKDCENGAYPAAVRDELLEDAYEVAQASELAENLDTKIKLEKLYSVIKAIAGSIK